MTGPPVTPPYRSVEPKGGDFANALLFTLRQELPPRERRRPGAALMVGAQGEVGIDPPAEREFARRNPEVSRELLEAQRRAYEGQPKTGVAGVRQRASSAAYHRSIYADIWNQSGAGKMPPQLALVHFDTWVQSPAAAQRILRQSRGDPGRYVALRRRWYEGLMTRPGADSPQGRFREAPAKQRGWVQQRIPALSAELERMGRGGGQR